MPVKPLEKTLDGVHHIVTPFPPLYAVRMAARLGKLLLPVAGAVGLPVAGGQVDIGAIRAGAGEAIPRLLTALADRLNPEELEALIVDLVSGVRRNGVALENRALVDATFAGDLPALYKVVWLALEANDFFGLGAIGKLLKLRPMAPPASTQDGSSLTSGTNSGSGDSSSKGPRRTPRSPPPGG